MKNKKGFFIGVFVGALLCGTSVYAAGKYKSSDITYKDTTVEKALNNLYTRGDGIIASVFNQSGSNYADGILGIYAIDNDIYSYNEDEGSITIKKNGNYKLNIVVRTTATNTSGTNPRYTFYLNDNLLIDVTGDKSIMSYNKIDSIEFEAVSGDIISAKRNGNGTTQSVFTFFLGKK